MGFPIYRIYKSTLDGWKQPQPGCFFRFAHLGNNFLNDRNLKNGGISI